MKKTFLTVALTILTIISVASQEKILFGIKGGINFTNMSGDFLKNKEYKTGFHIGGLVEIPFGSKFSLQPELLYSTYGVKGNEILLAVPYPDAPLVEPLEVVVKLNYIQLPVLAKFYLMESFSLEAGPSFNILVSSEFVRPNSTKKDVGESFEFGGIIGLSYKITSGFFVDFRYNRGFTDAFSWDGDNSKNYGFLLGVGYLF